MKFWFVIPWLIGYGLFTKIFERIQKTISIKKTLGNEIRKITSKYLNKIKTNWSRKKIFQNTSILNLKSIKKQEYFQNQRSFVEIKIIQKTFDPFLDLRMLKKLLKKKRDYFQPKYFLSPLAQRQILITPLILNRQQFQSSDNDRAKSRHSTPACSTPCK